MVVLFRSSNNVSITVDDAGKEKTKWVVLKELVTDETRFGVGIWSHKNGKKNPLEHHDSQTSSVPGDICFLGCLGTILEQEEVP